VKNENIFIICKIKKKWIYFFATLWKREDELLKEKDELLKEKDEER
jgi:hypothetical protein